MIICMVDVTAAVSFQISADRADLWSNNSRWNHSAFDGGFATLSTILSDQEQVSLLAGFRILAKREYISNK